MDPFEVKTLNQALSTVDSKREITALAKMVMKLSADKHVDPVWQMSEEMLLAALIHHEVKTAKQRSFANIYKMLDGDLDELLTNEPDWQEFKRQSTDGFRKGVVAGLSMRLSLFRHALA